MWTAVTQHPRALLHSRDPLRQLAKARREHHDKHANHEDHASHGSYCCLHTDQYGQRPCEGRPEGDKTPVEVHRAQHPASVLIGYPQLE